MNALKDAIESHDVNEIKDWFVTNREEIKEEDIYFFIECIEDAKMLSSIFCIVGDVILYCYEKLGESILNRAIMVGKDLKIIETIVNFDENSINRLDRLGLSPILNAVHFGQNNVIKYLLEKSADVSICKASGSGVLHFVVELEVMKLLIEYGADVNCTDKNGWTPLLNALRFKRDREIILEFINNGADFEKRSKDGDTCLHLALYNKYDEEVINEICSRTHDYNAENCKACALHDLPETTSYGTDFINNLINNKGFVLNNSSFLYVVKNCNNVDLITSFTKIFDARCVDTDGNNPLHYAKDVTLIDFFARRGASINLENEKGMTPLIEAIVSRKSSKVIERLLFWGSDLTKLASFLVENKTYTIRISDDVLRVLVTYGINISERSDFIKHEILSSLFFIAVGELDDTWTFFLLRYLFFNNTNFEIPEHPVISGNFIINNLLQNYNREINKMKDKKFINNSSYYDFCKKKYRFIRNQFTFETLKKADFNNKIEKLFPLYSDLIFLKIKINIKINKRKALLKKLNNVRIFKLMERENQSFGDEVLSCEGDCFDVDAMHSLGSFMNDREISCLLMASVLH